MIHFSMKNLNVLRRFQVQAHAQLNAWIKCKKVKSDVYGQTEKKKQQNIRMILLLSFEKEFCFCFLFKFKIYDARLTY